MTALRITLIFVLMAILASCAPAQTPTPNILEVIVSTEEPEASEVTPTPPALNPALPENHDDMPEVFINGVWSFECRYHFSVYTWTSHVTVGGQLMLVEIEFEEWEWRQDREHLLPIRIYPAEEEFVLDWLYVEEDGLLDPDISYFRDSEFVKKYYGDYAAFLVDFESMPVDWPSLYRAVRDSGYPMYENEDPELCPNSFDTEETPEPSKPILPLPWEELNA